MPHACGTHAILQFVMLDTVTLAGNSDVRDPSTGDLTAELTGDRLPGPADAAAAGEQMNWLHNTLKASNATYLVVAGHYPIWSICEHGPTSYMVDNVKPLLKKWATPAHATPTPAHASSHAAMQPCSHAAMQPCSHAAMQPCTHHAQVPHARAQRRYHVTAYIAGHDHCMESFLDDDIDYHGMGATHENDRSTAHRFKVPLAPLTVYSG